MCYKDIHIRGVFFNGSNHSYEITIGMLVRLLKIIDQFSQADPPVHRIWPANDQQMKMINKSTNNSIHMKQRLMIIMII